MKIIKLTAENIKRLVAVEITPDGNVVQITGKNEQGKTSVLDSIWWAIKGASHIQAVPIRKGADKARIRLDFGELLVTRRFNKGKGGSFTTSLTVEDADGKKVTSPQKMLDGLVGELSFDPLAFSRMDGKDQLNTLRRFVPGVDFAAIEKQNTDDYNARGDLNRRAKQARALADGISVPKDTPKESVDEFALVDQLQQAGEHNAAIETRKGRREQAQRDAKDKRAAAGNLNTSSASAMKEADRLLEQAAQDVKKLRAEAKELNDKAEAAVKDAEVIDKKLADAPPLPDPIDPAALRTKIEEARKTNQAVENAKRKAGHVDTARKLEEESAALTRTMENRNMEKRRAIEEAKMPVEGIELADGGVLLDGVPFDQASDAKRLRVSVSIAMASNPTLKVIRVRDGSLLDSDSMKLLAEMADTQDYQIWIERVDASGKTGVVLEDGQLKEEAS